MKALTFTLILALTSLVLSQSRSPAEEVTVKWSPTSPWIEIYHDGELSSEWQPADGAVYTMLKLLLEDDLTRRDNTPGTCIAGLASLAKVDDATEVARYFQFSYNIESLLERREHMRQRWSLVLNS